MPDEMDLNPRGWRRPTWLLLLVAASVALTFTFSCAAPIAAFAAACACTLPRRDAYSAAGAVWLANQGVGFAFLHYPWTMNCLAWGAALGATALLSTLAARLTLRRLAQVWAPARNSVTFLAAFAAYEAALIVFSLLLGGAENFTPAIQGRIFAINTVALVGLLALDRVGVVIATVETVRPRRSKNPTRIVARKHA